MNERRKIEDRIRKKEVEIQEFNEKAREAAIYVQALQDVLKMLPRDADSAGEGGATLRPGSAAAWTREIILRMRRPVHINELLRAMGKDSTRVNSASLAGSLAAYVRKGEIFTRPAPNKFWLLELGDPPAAKPAQPPKDFGAFEDDLGEAPDDGGEEIEDDRPF